MTANIPKIPSAKSGIGPKVITIGLLVMLLWLISFMVSSLIRERSERHDQAIAEISAKWGSQQVLSGPLLVIPYRSSDRVEDGNKIRTVTSIHYASFLPESLILQGQLKPEIRHRGIYEAVLYSSQIKLGGEFKRPDFSKLNIPESSVLWNQATLCIGITDLRGIQESANLTWNGKSYPFAPSDGEFPIFESAIHIKGLAVGQPSHFSADLQLNGSNGLSFLPLGRKTLLTLSSAWPDPSFDGQFLPLSSKISEQGFSADWSILELARSFPQQWRDRTVSAEQLGKYSFGVNLVQPASAYQKNDRAINYANLFIILTFAAFFLFEVLANLQLHFLQYGLVGAALVVFYLLLLSISEHTGFGPAYFISSSVTTLLVAGYCRSVLAQGDRALLMASLLAGLYGFLYVVLQLEDYALLMGSSAVFVALALVMWLTRRVNWFEMGTEKK